MDIKEKHKFFITEGYVFSPDGGDAGIFTDCRLHGVTHAHWFAKTHPSLMLGKYHGKYPFMYLFCREFVPAFEILAKAGYDMLADSFIEEYMGYDRWFYTANSTGIEKTKNHNMSFFHETMTKNTFMDEKINIYGKNDRQIFGFKLSKFNSLHFNFKTASKHFSSMAGFIKTVGMVAKERPGVFNYPVDEDLFLYIYRHTGDRTLLKDIGYLNHIGTHNASMYSDYLNMCRQTGKFTEGVYPENLKHAHDVMVSYCNEMKEIEKNKCFASTVSSAPYQSLLYSPENEKYCILAPRKAEDLAREGLALSHCVRSYIRDVANGFTRIYFLRLQEKKAKPLITIEVKNNAIVQCRGKANRNPDTCEYGFIRMWAKEKNILFKYNPW